MPEPVLSLEPCRPVEEHARLVMDWRNDAQTLAMFYHHTPKRWDGFWPEFRDTYFTHPALPPLFLCADGTPVAFLRYQPAEHPLGAPGRTVDVSINVSPQARGCGYGRTALVHGADFLRRVGIDHVVAEIRTENAASRQAFLSAGYRLLDETDKVVADTGERCRIARYLLDLEVPGAAAAMDR
ncbi:MAG: GNAT family N-acetyltransferase [Solirubrobacterales bacterium]